MSENMEERTDNKSPKTKLNKKLRFKHHPNLSNKVLSVICGRSGCGKTYLLFKILTTPNFLDYNNLIIYTTTSEQPIYQFLKHGFENKLSKPAIASLFEEYEKSEYEEEISSWCEEAAKNEHLIESDKKKHISIELIDDNGNMQDPNKLDKTKKHCVVFDDCVNNKDQSIQRNYFTRGRHNNCSVFYLTQSMYSLDGSVIRKNANIFMLFEINSRNLMDLLRDLCVRDRVEFKHSCNNAWSKDYGFITVNIDKKVNERVIEDLFGD